MVHSWDCSLDVRAFKELQRDGLAEVTTLPGRRWAAELGERDREALEVTVPAGNRAVAPVDEGVLQLRVREEPMRVVGRISHGHGFDITPLPDGQSAAVSGWTFCTLHPSGSGLVYGWVSVDAQPCDSWSSSRNEAASALLAARTVEAAHTAAARTAANAIHSGPHCFLPVCRQDHLLGYTFRLALQTTGACAWVTPDGTTVGRRVHQYHHEAASALIAYLDGPARTISYPDARTAVHRVFPHAYNLLRVYQREEERPLLGWVFSVASDPLGAPGFGWITTAGRVSDQLLADHSAALTRLAGEVALDTPWRVG